MVKESYVKPEADVMYFVSEENLASGETTSFIG